MNVCEVTIRKDLNKLDEKGLLKRTHGGAIAIVNVQFESSLIERECKNLTIKSRIGKVAVELIRNGDAIILDSGTTTYQIAKNLKCKNFTELTVITNSIPIAYELLSCPNIHLIVLGGECRSITGALVGSFTENTLSKIYVDKVFLGANGLSLDRGLTAPNPTEAYIKSMMAKSANKRIAVLDHTKIGQEYLVSFCPISELDILVIDRETPSEYVDAFKNMGVELILA